MLGTFNKIRNYVYQQRAVLLWAFIYMIVVSWLASFHVIWRDEQRVLSTVFVSNSIIQLFQNIHNEGHPYLWYLILYFAYYFWHNTIVLKIVSIAVAVGTIYVFLLKSPFSWPQKILFIFGFYPIYEYSVLCRDYVLIMPLLFIFSSLYEERYERILLVSLVLFLLANTNGLACIITMAIFLSMLVELMCNKRLIMDYEKQKYGIVAGFLIILTGIVLCILQIFPDKTTTCTDIYHLSFKSFINNFVFFIINLGNSFHRALGFYPMKSALILCFFVYLLRFPFVLLFFSVSIAALGLFGYFVYPLTAVYHEGLVYILIITALWISFVMRRHPNTFNSSVNRIFLLTDKIMNVFLYFLLLLQI